MIGAVKIPVAPAKSSIHPASARVICLISNSIINTMLLNNTNNALLSITDTC